MNMNTPRQATSEYDRPALVALYNLQRQIPAKEKARLFVEARQGSDYARHQLVTAHVKIAFDYVNNGLKRGDLGPHIAGGMEYGDLINEGMAGLTDAVDNFDPRRGAMFELYAKTCVKNAINKAMLNQEDSIRLPAKPSRLQRDIYKLEQAMEDAGAKHYFTDQELAERFSVPLTEILNARYAPSVAMSLDKQTSTGDPLSTVIGDTRPDERAERELQAPTPEDNRLSPEEMAVNDLPEAYAQVIRCRYFQNLSVKDTAAELKRPIDRVKAQEESGLELLRKTMKKSQSAERGAQASRAALPQISQASAA